MRLVPFTGAPRARNQASVEQLLDLALLQGNRFIKEFLRSKGLRIGANKAAFEQHLREAIADNRLRPADIQEWLAEVEGWGNQHVFSYDVPAGAPQLSERQTFVDRVRAAGLDDLVDADIPLAPGETLELATVRHFPEAISFVWVRGSPARFRRKDLDYEEEIDGDDVEFHAYERRWSRVAARFEWLFEANLAAVLLARHEERNYAEQRDLVLRTVDSVIPERRSWPSLDVPRIITQLDSAGLEAAEGEGVVTVRMHSTVFYGASANVRLAARTEASGYQNDAGVREVRRAVDPTRLTGGAGDCYLTPSGEEERRELHLRLYGPEQRVLLWGRMTSQEVWDLVTDLRAYAAA
jgi:hypothetical protein